MSDRPTIRRTDPDRRSRIIDACLDVIAREGVAGTSHRRVAAVADVPLGSMTYHFAGMDELLLEAFTRFADRVADRFEERMAAAANPQDALEAVARIILDDVFPDQDELVLTHELYTLAARKPAFRRVTNGWMTRSRTALERHFHPDVARMLDPLIEGLTIHRALDEQTPDERYVREAITRIVALRPGALPREVRATAEIASVISEHRSFQEAGQHERLRGHRSVDG